MAGDIMWEVTSTGDRITPSDVCTTYRLARRRGRWFLYRLGDDQTARFPWQWLGEFRTLRDGLSAAEALRCDAERRPSPARSAA
jgi:hypothetical protein